MRKIKSFLAVLAATAMLMTAPMAVSANSPKSPYDLSWSGDELPSLVFNWCSIDKFIKINVIFNENETPLESSAYTITGDESSTKLTFNKSYLDTLEEGEYNYRAYYSINEWRDDRVGTYLYQDENDSCIFRGKINDVGSNTRVKQLSCNIELDPSVYTISVDNGNVEVVFDKKFIEENGDEITVLTFSTESYVETSSDWIRLNVSADTNSSEPETVVYSDYQDAGSPKTGDEGISAVSVFLALSGLTAYLSVKRRGVASADIISPTRYE